jgi:hypothetical protein
MVISKETTAITNPKDIPARTILTAPATTTSRIVVSYVLHLPSGGDPCSLRRRIYFTLLKPSLTKRKKSRAYSTLLKPSLTKRKKVSGYVGGMPSIVIFE